MVFAPGRRALKRTAACLARASSLARQGRAATRIEQLEDVTKTTKTQLEKTTNVVNQNAVSRNAAHSNLKQRVDLLDGAYAQLVARLHKLELNSPSPEPVADRTRSRKQPRT